MARSLLLSLRSNRNLSGFVIKRHLTNSGISTNLQEAINSYEDFDFIPFRLVNCMFGAPFSCAQLRVVQYLQDNEGNIKRPLFAPQTDIRQGNIFTYSVPFRDIFENGFNCLNHTVNANTCAVTRQSSPKTDEKPNKSPFQMSRSEHLVETLDKFFIAKEYHEECLKILNFGMADFKKTPVLGYEHLTSLTEGDISVLLANHLLSQLASSNMDNEEDHYPYMISKDTKNKRNRCPCLNSCNSLISYGNTSFGSEFVWYGNADIMVQPVGGMCNVAIFGTKTKKLKSFVEKEEVGSNSQISDTKQNKIAIRQLENVKQIVAQAITFAFYQKKLQTNKKPPKSSLIPTIAACKDGFDIYLYDFKYDVLLRNVGPPIPFHKKSTNEFNSSALLQLWMVINHTFFSPHLDVCVLNQLKNSCELGKFADDTDFLMYVMDSMSSSTVKPRMETRFDEEYDDVFLNRILKKGMGNERKMVFKIIKRL